MTHLTSLSIDFTMNAKEIRTIIGIIGNAISFFISLSQMPKVIQTYKKKSVEHFQQHRHVVMVMKCSLWVLYGLPLVQKDSILVTTSNGVGFVIEVIYLVVFFFYTDPKSRMEVSSAYQNTGLCLAIEFSFVATVYGITLWFIEPLSARRTFIGVVCNVFTITMHVLLAMTAMLKTNSYRCMPFWLSFVSFINVGIWTAYSLIYKIDIYILIINGLGTLACAYQLIAHAYYYAKIIPSGNVLVV